MSKKRSAPVVDQHWHLDCRLEAELPEDNVIGSKFLLNVCFGSAALITLLGAILLGYRDLSRRSEISDWENRIEENRTEMAEVKKAQVDFGIEAYKIDQAFSAFKTPIYVSGFVAAIAHTRPEKMSIDEIAMDNENRVFIRGTIADSFVNASTIFNAYLAKVKGDPEIAPLFELIYQSGFSDTRVMIGRVNFEITLKKKATGP